MSEIVSVATHIHTIRCRRCDKPIEITYEYVSGHYVVRHCTTSVYTREELDKLGDGAVFMALGRIAQNIMTSHRAFGIKPLGNEE